MVGVQVQFRCETGALGEGLAMLQVIIPYHTKASGTDSSGMEMRGKTAKENSRLIVTSSLTGPGVSSL